MTNLIRDYKYIRQRLIHLDLNMRIRIRTSEGQWRCELSDDATLEDLITNIANQYSFESPSELIFSTDQRAPFHPIPPNTPFNQLGFKDGQLLVLVPHLRKSVAANTITNGQINNKLTYTLHLEEGLLAEPIHEAKQADPPQPVDIPREVQPKRIESLVPEPRNQSKGVYVIY